MISIFLTIFLFIFKDAADQSTRDTSTLEPSTRSFPSTILSTFFSSDEGDSDDAEFLPLLDESVNTTAASMLSLDTSKVPAEESLLASESEYFVRINECTVMIIMNSIAQRNAMIIIFTLFIISLFIFKFPGPGYAFVWDNVQKLSEVRDSSSGHKNTMHLWANAFAAINRVDPIGLDDNELTLKATEIPISSFLHNKDDESMLRTRMSSIIGRVLVTHLKYFRDNYEDVVTWHIPHAHSEEMAEKSTIVCLMRFVIFAVFLMFSVI